MAIPILPRANLPTDADLDAFETEFGYPLPPDYRAFLRSHDGGRLDPPLDAEGLEHVAAFHAEPIPPLPPDDAMIAPGHYWDVAVFHGLLREPREYGDLRLVLDAVRSFGHAPELLPVASAVGGGKFFLCADGPLRGQVLVAVTALYVADERPVTQADYHRVAPSFGAMLDGLEWLDDARQQRLWEEARRG